MAKKRKSAHEQATVLAAPTKMGRPPLDEALRRTWRISIVVNRSELDTITAQAAADGETVSVWGRKRLMEAAEK